MKQIIAFLTLFLVYLPCGWAQEMPIKFRIEEKQIDMSIAVEKDVSYALNQVKATTTITIGSKADIDEESLKAILPPGFSIKGITDKGTSVILQLATPGYRVTQHSREKHGIVVKYVPDKTVVATTPSPKEKDQASKEGKAETTEEENPLTEKEKKLLQTSGEFPTSGVLEIEGTTKESRLVFKFPEKRTMAAFLRDGYYWFVFDNPYPLEVKGTLLRSFGKLQQHMVAPLAIFEFKRKTGVTAHISQENNDWIVTLNDEVFMSKANSRKDLNGNLIYPDEGYPTYEIPANKVGRQYDFADPRRGDRVIVYTLGDLGRNFEDGVSFADFEILPSLQGVVITTKTNDLEVSHQDNTIKITRPQGLYVSSRKDREGSITRLNQSKLLDFQKWANFGDNYIETRNQLELEVSLAPISKRSEAYFKLIRYNLSKGYGAEALGLLRLLSDDVPGLIHDPHFLALRGVAFFLAGDATLALHDFTSRELTPIEDVKLWKGVTLNKLKQTAIGTELVAKHIKQIEELPPYLRIRVALNGAMAAVEMKKANLAETLAEIIAATEMPDALKQDFELLKAYMAANQDKQEEADSQFTHIQTSHEGKAAALAEIALIQRDFGAKRIEIAEAIKRLEALRYSWRGSEIEWKLLNELGRLYIEAGDFKQGLSTMGVALKYYPDAKEYNQLETLMTNTFLHLFSPEGQKKVSPVAAVSLYRSFKSLTPKGEKGDQVVISLAHNLQELDLTELAAKALGEHFAASKFFNPNLALEYITALILAQQSDKALSIIQTTEDQKLTQDQRQQLTFLKVKALANIGKFEEGLQILQADKSEAADGMRAGLYWKTGKWGKAAQNLEKVIEKQDEKSPAMLISYALALYKAKDKEKLRNLRVQYEKTLEGTPQENAFKILTSPDLTGNVKLNQKDLHLSQVSEFENFLNVDKK